MTDEDLTVGRPGEVDVLMLRRPEARNALTHRTYAELEEPCGPARPAA